MRELLLNLFVFVVIHVQGSGKRNMVRSGWNPNMPSRRPAFVPRPPSGPRVRQRPVSPKRRDEAPPEDPDWLSPPPKSPSRSRELDLKPLKGESSETASTTVREPEGIVPNVRGNVPWWLYFILAIVFVFGGLAAMVLCRASGLARNDGRKTKPSPLVAEIV